MMRFFTSISLLFSFLLMGTIVPTSFAVDSGQLIAQTAPPIYNGTLTTPDGQNGEAQQENPFDIDNIRDELLPRIARGAGSFIGAIAVLALIWAGIQFLTAGGEEEKISKATKTAVYVLAALLLMMFAYVLVYLFLTIFTPPGSTT